MDNDVLLAVAPFYPVEYLDTVINVLRNPLALGKPIDKYILLTSRIFAKEKDKMFSLNKIGDYRSH